MNGFHAWGRGISAQERTRTTGKKIANWTVGNNIGRGLSHCPPMTRFRSIAALLTLAALGLALPAAARAGCGGVVSAKPRHRAGTQAPPLFIGDSTGIFA